jgi:hypothetical protein
VTRLTKNPISSIVAIIVSVVLLYTVLNLSKWKSYGVLKHDIYSYYNYLPAKFIYNDLSFGYGQSLPKEYRAEVWCVTNPKGECLNKMTMGLSYLYAPFFFTAHILAKPLGYPADGYSKIYHLLMAFAPLFYGIIGVWLLRWLLLRWFSDWPVALTIAAVYLGTNLFFYLTAEGNMTHGYILFLSIVYISLLWKWNHRPLKQTAFFIGLVIGLITLIRPIDLLLVMVIPLWQVDSLKSLKFRLNYLWLKRIHVTMMILGFVIPIIPQMLYWYDQSGQFVYYSYGDEGFFWTDPKILKGLFSFRKGWLIYSPVMALGLLGIVSLYKQKHELKLATTLFVSIFIYVVFSWWCWWYGGSYGMRPMIDVYALLAISMAAFLQGLQKQSKKVFSAIGVLVVLLIGLNQFQTAQYRWGIIHYHGMNWATYKATFLKPNYPNGYDKLIEEPNYEEAKKGNR